MCYVLCNVMHAMYDTYCSAMLCCVMLLCHVMLCYVTIYVTMCVMLCYVV